MGPIAFTCMWLNNECELEHEHDRGRLLPELIYRPPAAVAYYTYNMRNAIRY